MRFGTRQLPVRLRVARTIVYCQAALVILIALFALEILILGGTGTGFPLSGIFADTTVTGNGMTILAILYFAVAVALVAVEQRAATRGGTDRLTLVGTEIALAVYLIGFAANSPGAWICAPAAGIAILVLHYWPELTSYFLVSDAGTPAPASPEQPAPITDPGADGTAPPPL
jgi:hypothetical protein